MTMMERQPIPRRAEERVNHPAHYGGANNPHEPIKIIKHYKLNFALGCVIKYVLRAELKGTPLEDLKKALWYLQDEISEREKTLPREETYIPYLDNTSARAVRGPALLAKTEVVAESITPEQSEVSSESHHACQECINPVEEADDALCDRCHEKRWGRPKVRSVPSH